MKVIRAWKFRLYPTKLQESGMWAHLRLSKALWNDMLEFAIEIYDNHKKFPTKKSLREMVKNSGLYSQVGQELVDRLIDALQRKIKLKKHGIAGGFPRFKSMDRMKSLHYPQSGFSISGRKLKITPFGEINIRKHREMAGTIKTLTLKREPSGRWFAIFTTETESVPVPRKEGKQIGIDLGLMTFATLSNGEKIKKPNHMRDFERQLADAQRKLSKKKLRSKNRSKTKLKVARIHFRIANTRKDWLHKAANSLLAKYSLIALEDLDVQGIADKHGKGVSDAGWSIFTDIISYKAEGAGCEVVFVDPKNTTKDCSRCGTCVRKEEHERMHSCPSCGLSMDRDHNAAINILNRATGGTSGSNACEDVSIETSMKQDARGFIPW